METEHEQPIISITGTNGKTTVARMIALILRAAGRGVSLKTSDETFASRENLLPGLTQNSTPQAAPSSTAHIQVLETTCEAIAQNGLSYECSNISVITNIQPDHFGQHGIETVEDVLKIKSLVAERTCAHGAIVLNADDDLLARLENDLDIKRTTCRAVYFSLKSNHITLKRHISRGGTAYTVRNNWLMEITSQSETPIVEISEIPATLEGCAEFNIANALAAAAACRADDLEIEEVAHGLRTFQIAEQNPGRADLFEVDGAYVLLDAARNPSAVKAVCKLANNWNDGVRRIVGIVCARGDSANDLLVQTGRIAARNFDRLIVRETENAALKARGAAAHTLYQAVKSEHSNLDCRLVQNESEAVRREITRLQPGDVLVCFYEDYETVRSILARCDAAPVVEIKPFTLGSNFNLRHA